MLERIKVVLGPALNALQPCVESVKQAGNSDELVQLRASEARLTQEIAERDAQMVSQAKILATVRQESAAAKAECIAIISERDGVQRELEKVRAELAELEDVAAAVKMENAMLQAEGGQLRHELKMMGSPSATAPTPDRHTLRKSVTTPNTADR